MPELPDVQLYVEAMQERLCGEPLQALRISSPFLLRTVTPGPSELHGRTVAGVSRLGKRIVLEFDNAVYAVIHLMIAGRLFWRKTGCAIPRGRGLAAFDFAHGSLLYTEVSKKKRASLHLVDGDQALAAFDRGGIEVLECGLEKFSQGLTRENHTLKRVLTDPTLFSGIGNAYSDEILFRARLSPFRQTRNLRAEEIADLYHAVVQVLETWTQRLRDALKSGFPEKVTAFHPEMAVHGKYRQPCPECGAPVQRIVYAERECNYCARCQTGGRVLADRALSRLLKQNWPHSIDEPEG